MELCFKELIYFRAPILNLLNYLHFIGSLQFLYNFTPNSGNNPMFLVIFKSDRQLSLNFTGNGV